MYVLHFNDRPDNGPRNVGPFPTRETAFVHADAVIAGRTGSYEAWPLAAHSPVCVCLEPPRITPEGVERPLTRTTTPPDAVTGGPDA